MLATAFNLQSSRFLLYLRDSESLRLSDRFDLVADEFAELRAIAARRGEWCRLSLASPSAAELLSSLRCASCLLTTATGALGRACRCLRASPPLG